MVTRLRILITGGAGFIGANLARHFTSIGHEVIVTQRKKKVSWRLNGAKNIKISLLDLTEREAAFDAINSLKPDVVIHTACYGGYHFETEPYKIFRTNLLGTINILDASIDSGVSLFINTGSSSEYGIKEKPMAESDIIFPKTDYAISKSLATECCSYKNSSKTKTVTLRLFSAYGYYEEKHRLIPYLLYSSIKKRKAKISALSNVRDFVFIEDINYAYERTIKFAPKIIGGSIINIGSGAEYTVKDVINNIQGLEVEIESGERKQEAIKHWRADINKASKILGWKPKIGLKEGLDKTRSWMEENLELYENDLNEKSKKS